MSADISFIDLFLQASVVVQGVMLILLLASLISWTLIFQRAMVLKRAKSYVEKFEDRFWSGVELSKLYNDINSRRQGAVGLELVFQAGFKEFVRLRKQMSGSPQAVMDGASRAMRIAISREMEVLESHLPFLATVGSTSPYVGLFGTVWGIMNSFMALGNVQQATLSMVAPGIAEALIATAMGLFAAIPAVIAYNRFSAATERVENAFENFREEFTGILHRQAHASVSVKEQEGE